MTEPFEGPFGCTTSSDCDAVGLTDDVKKFPQDKANAALMNLDRR